jgi:hypothetical protein
MDKRAIDLISNTNLATAAWLGELLRTWRREYLAAFRFLGAELRDGVSTSAMG